MKIQMQKRLLNIILLGVLSLYLVACSSKDLTQPLPLDENIIQGTLENGMAYYLYPTEEYPDTAYIQVTVRAGSINETDEEQGLAHYLEHLAFNSTEKYNREQIASIERDLGIEFGSHSNAYTSFNETNYNLSLQDLSPKRLEAIFDIMSQRTLHITFNPDEVEAERGVILGEERLRSASSYTKRYESIQKTLLEGTLYPQRFPIGKVEIIKNATPELLKGFYDKWYQPKNMAVAILGDISEEEIMPLLQKYFGSKTSSTALPPRPDIGNLTKFSNPRYHAYFDPSFTVATIEVKTVFDTIDEQNGNKLKKNIIQQVLFSYLHDAFNRYVEYKKFDSALMYLAAGDDLIAVRDNLRSLNLRISVFEDQLDRGTQELQTFFSTVYKDLQNEETIEKIVEEMDDYMDFLDSAPTPYLEEIARDIVNNFVHDEPIVDSQKLIPYLKTIRHAITQDDIINLYQKLIYDANNKSVFISLGDSFKEIVDENSTQSTLIQGMDISQMFAPTSATIEDIDFFPPEDLRVDSLMSFDTKGEILDEEITTSEVNPKDQLYTWKLDNGLTVLYRQISDADDKTGIIAYNPALWYLFEMKNHYLIPIFETAIDYSFYKDVRLSNIYSSDEFKDVQYLLMPGELHVSTNKKKEVPNTFKLLNVIHRTLAIQEETALNRAKYEYLLQYRERLNTPFEYSLFKLHSLNNKNFSLYQDPFDEKSVTNISLQDMQQIQDAWLHTKDTVYFIAGEESPSKIKKLVEKWIATIPTESVFPIDKSLYQFEFEPAEEKVNRIDEESISLIIMNYQTRLKQDELTITAKEIYTNEIASMYVSEKIMARIREELGAIYAGGGHVLKQVDFKKVSGKYQMLVYIPPEAEQAELLVNELNTILQSLIPLDERFFEQIKNIVKSQISEPIKSEEKMDVTLQQMKNRYGNLPMLLTDDEKLEIVNNISIEDLQELLQMLLQGSKTTLITYPAGYDISQNTNVEQ